MIRYEISACQKSPDRVKWVEGTEWVQETEWVQGVAEDDEVDRLMGLKGLSGFRRQSGLRELTRLTGWIFFKAAGQKTHRKQIKNFVT